MRHKRDLLDINRPLTLVAQSKAEREYFERLCAGCR